MRPYPIAFALVLLLAALLKGEDKPLPPPVTVDLKANPLVQKALADQDKAAADVEADYAQKLEALKAERQKKLDAAKTNCVTALRRAEAVSNARNNKDEALTIKALADSIQSEVSPPPTETKVANNKAFVGKWMRPSGLAFILKADGTCVDEGNPKNAGKWTVSKEGNIEVRWANGNVDSYRHVNEKKWLMQTFIGGTLKGQTELTQP